MQVTTCKLVKLKQSRQNQHTRSREKKHAKREKVAREKGNGEQVQVLGENELCMCSRRSRYSLAGRAKRENVIRAN